MKKILLKDYREVMGEFIDLNEKDNKLYKTSRHINYENLIINHKELLDKNKKYFLYCNGGVKSKKAANILEFYGYDVTIVYKN